MEIPYVSSWEPEETDKLFKYGKNIIVAPVTSFLAPNGELGINIDSFLLNIKKSYNNDDFKIHYCKYVNYFEKYFDTEKEYFTNMAFIKYQIDVYYKEYQVPNFMNDINRYIIQPSIVSKLMNMVNYNYSLSLSYKSANNPQLQYNDNHGKVLICISLLMNLCAPLITHFACAKRITNINEFILDVYDNIIYYKDFGNTYDIINKLYQTVYSNVNKNEKSNPTIWGKQDIRGKDVVIHSEDGLKNIILTIMPKYVFDQNMVNLNHTSIQKHNKYQVTDISYEYTFLPMSSAAGDGEDNASELDKYEAGLTKSDESLYIQSNFNCMSVMKHIEQKYGPFDPKEVDFYIKELSNEKGEYMNQFQKELVFNLFYKYFGDTESPNGINGRMYIELMLAAKKMLSRDANMRYLPYILSGKVDKIVSRKTLNKRELSKMEASPLYQQVYNKYRNDKPIKLLLGTIATIITSDFRIIDYDPTNNNLRPGCNGNLIVNAGELHGKRIQVEPDFIIEETLLFALNV